MNDQKINKIVTNLAAVEGARADLYFSPGRVDSLYTQTVGQINELARTSKDSGKFSASLLQLFGTEISAEEALEVKVSLTPLMQAMIIERAARETDMLIDLKKTDAIRGHFLYYVGPMHMTREDSPITPNETGLPVETCNVITQLRDKQEKGLRFSNNSFRTIVFTFQARRKIYAMIASTEHSNFGHVVSYENYPTKGMLGRFEQIQNNVTFISPIWVWADEW